MEDLPTKLPISPDSLVGQAIVNGQIVKYPKIVKEHIDPEIYNQVIGCVSFNMLPAPQKLKNGATIHGFVKLRGNHPSEERATEESSKIVLGTDSRHVIQLVRVGCWVPLTVASDVFSNKTVEISDEENSDLKRKAELKRRQEEQRIRREIKEREEDLRNDGDIYDDPTSPKYFSMKRYTEFRLMEECDRIRASLADMEGKLLTARHELGALATAHPEYEGTWLSVYNAERKGCGLFDFILPEKYALDHNEWMRENYGIVQPLSSESSENTASSS